MKTRVKTKPANPETGMQKRDSDNPTKPERPGVARLEHKNQADALTDNEMADLFLAPSTNAAAVLSPFLKSTFGEVDIGSLAMGLEKSIGEVQGGNLKECEAMLMGQAHALQAIFMTLARRAQSQDFLHQFETHMRLAMKAQSQCRATLETLTTIKNPPAVFARQANFTTGPQQVNIGTLAPAGKVETNPNELLEAQDAKRLDG